MGAFFGFSPSSAYTTLLEFTVYYIMKQEHLNLYNKQCTNSCLVAIQAGVEQRVVSSSYCNECCVFPYTKYLKVNALHLWEKLQTPFLSYEAEDMSHPVSRYNFNNTCALFTCLYVYIHVYTHQH